MVVLKRLQDRRPELRLTAYPAHPRFLGEMLFGTKIVFKESEMPKFLMNLGIACRKKELLSFGGPLDFSRQISEGVSRREGKYGQ